MPPRVPEEEPEFIEGDGQREQVDPELAEIIDNQLEPDAIEDVVQGDQNDPGPNEIRDRAVIDIYGNDDTIGQLIRAFRERPEENNTVVGRLLTGIRIFYEYPQLILLYGYLMGDAVHRIAIQQIGQNVRYVIVPERIVAAVPRNADGILRQMNVDP